MTEEKHDDTQLNAEQKYLIDNLPAKTISQIDAAILAKVDQRFRKVAYIVGSIMDSFPGVPAGYFVIRIIYLVNTSCLESQGNLRNMRYSEIRKI